jgi:hypothetical protein
MRQVVVEKDSPRLSVRVDGVIKTAVVGRTLLRYMQALQLHRSE